MKYSNVAASVGLALLAALPAAAQTITVSPSKPNAVYASGETLAWDLKVTNDPGAVVQSVHYRVKRGGGTVVAEGDAPVVNGAAQITSRQDEPMAYLVEVRATGADGKEIQVFGGAAVAPGRIRPAAARPADFDAFWKAKLAALAAVPMHPVVEPGASERENVDYARVTLDNINGAKVRAQIARPKSGGKFPALLILQWAGVYGLPKTNVTNYAARGWLAMNVMAHDLPFDESPEFYKRQNETTLRDYINIGNKSRETSYFLRMVLGCYRASEYLMSRPDWDGRILVATGTSQGGFQSFAVTALQPKITAMIVNVPAGSDSAAQIVGRGTSWPFYANNGSDPAVMETSRYFDNVNFASRIRVPSLIGVGMVDQTSTPTGVFAAANQIRGPKEMVVMPFSDHQGQGGTQSAYYQRADAWLKALEKGAPVPLNPRF